MSTFCNSYLFNVFHIIIYVYIQLVCHALSILYVNLIYVTSSAHYVSQTPRVRSMFRVVHMVHKLTYGPHKAVAEVSNHNEPIGRTSGIQLVRKSMDFTFNCFVLN